MDTLAIQIDLASPTPAYRQIADALRTLLVTGQLPPATHLPTVRQLAADLTVHHNTVAQAYRILADEGFLSLRRGRGALVTERTAPAPSPADERWLARRLRETLAQALSKGMPREHLLQLCQAALDATTSTPLNPAQEAPHEQ